MKLFFARIQYKRFGKYDEDINTHIRCESKEQAEAVIRADYEHIYQLNLTDITWSEETA